MENSNSHDLTTSVDSDDEILNCDGTKKVQNQVGTVLLRNVSIVSLYIDNQERLCLAQISNTLLRDYSYNEIHNRRVALGITCVQCTPVQLEILRRAGAMPVSSRRCGMITRREAERLVKSFLEEITPPKLPENFSFDVVHHCGWGCRGSFVPSRYNSSRAKCIKCYFCSIFFSPNKFIFHCHRTPNANYNHPDAANFNSWRRHLNLMEQSPSNDLVYAWEDVKAMFNGGSRKRVTGGSSPPSSLRSDSPEAKRCRIDSTSPLSQTPNFQYPVFPMNNSSYNLFGNFLQRSTHPAFPYLPFDNNNLTVDKSKFNMADVVSNNMPNPATYPYMWRLNRDTNRRALAETMLQSKKHVPWFPDRSVLQEGCSKSLSSLEPESQHPSAFKPVHKSQNCFSENEDEEDVDVGGDDIKNYSKDEDSPMDMRLDTRTRHLEDRKSPIKISAADIDKNMHQNLVESELNRLQVLRKNANDDYRAINETLQQLQKSTQNDTIEQTELQQRLNDANLALEKFATRIFALKGEHDK